jgi:hypothetical protein
LLTGVQPFETAMPAAASSAATDPDPAARFHRAQRGLAAATRNWWQQAQRLEATDQLAAAEQLICACCPAPDYARTLAELYQLRMHRLGAAGDREGERHAFLQTVRWIDRYASLVGDTR